MPREERPPYVMFELRTQEDRTQSIAKGHWVGRDVPFVLITPQGSKDRIERVAEDWFAEKRAQATEGRYPRAWLDAHRASFEAWRRDEEPPVNGSPLRNWPPLSPTQYKVLRELRVLTVEDLAAANEETISRIGPGARALKSKAEVWLSTAAGTGMQVEEAERLRIENEGLRQVNDAQTLMINEYRGREENRAEKGTVISGAERSFVEEALGN